MNKKTGYIETGIKARMKVMLKEENGRMVDELCSFSYIFNLLY